MDKFDKSKRYVFSKDNFLTDSVAATLYKKREGTRNWVNGCDGQEVTVLSERAGIVDECLVHVCQCEELPSIGYLRGLCIQVMGTLYKEKDKGESM